MELWILLLVIAGVGTAVFFMRRKPAPPAKEPEDSDAAPEIRAMLSLREQLATESLDPAIRGEVDEVFVRAARVGAEAMTSPNTNRATLRSMKELLQGTTRNGWNLASTRTTRVALEELALLTHRGDDRVTSQEAIEFSEWANNLAKLPNLQVKGTTTADLLLSLKPGDWLMVEGQLCTVGDSGLARYEETYQGQRWEWHEIPAVRFRDGATIGIDWELDDGVEFSITEAEYSLPEMSLTPVRVREMIENESGSVTIGNSRFDVNESGTAVMHRRGQAEEFDYVELTGANGRTLTLEDWGDELSGFVSRDLPLREIKLLEVR